MTDNQLNLLAATFARSNMGFPIEDFSELVFVTKTLSTAVERVCGEFVEKDEHFDSFMEEARGWKELLLSDVERAKYRRSSPHVFEACGV
jgi:hypothetical protein